MDRSIHNLASTLSRERTAALERTLEDRARHADRGVVVTPRRPVVDAIVGLGIWLRGMTVRPRRPRLS